MKMTRTKRIRKLRISPQIFPAHKTERRTLPVCRLLSQLAEEDTQPDDSIENDRDKPKKEKKSRAWKKNKQAEKKAFSDDTEDNDDYDEDDEYDDDYDDDDDYDE